MPNAVTDILSIQTQVPNAVTDILSIQTQVPNAVTDILSIQTAYWGVSHAKRHSELRRKARQWKLVLKMQVFRDITLRRTVVPSFSGPRTACLVYEANIILRNVHTHLPNNTVSHPRILEHHCENRKFSDAGFIRNGHSLVVQYSGMSQAIYSYQPHYNQLTKYADTSTVAWAVPVDTAH